MKFAGHAEDANLRSVLRRHQDRGGQLGLLDRQLKPSPTGAGNGNAAW